jgi:poly-gamma-glutamate synthesis protein (capsule biosynthesis protein)
MQHDSQIKAAYNDKATALTYDYSPCFQFIKPYTESVDLAIGNLELTLAGPPFKGYPQFSAPDELALTLKDIGMDVLVTANNHCVDRGKNGVDRTIEMLDSLKILHTGTFRDTVDRMNDYPLIFEKNGFRIALLNYTFSTNGLPVTKPNVVNMLDTVLIRKDLVKAKESKPDIVIVFTHWGIEYQSQPSALQKAVAEFCMKKGVNLVIGSHPHVLQPMEWRKENNQVITYSLGNFVSGQRDRYKNGGAMLEVNFTKIVKDSLPTTTIGSAGYILEWVYRTEDDDKDYYILPVPSFENDTIGFIKDEVSRAAFKTFVEDSRNFLNRSNLKLNEIKKKPSLIKISKSDSIFVKGRIEGFYSWYGEMIRNKTVNKNFNPVFIKSNDGMTTLDFSNYKLGLKNHGFTDDFIEIKINGYKKCSDNLGKIKYETFAKFEDLEQLEDIKCDFSNIYEWTNSMESPTGVELTEVKFLNKNIIQGVVHFFYTDKIGKKFTWDQKAIVDFLHQGNEWKINNLKFERL